VLFGITGAMNSNALQSSPTPSVTVPLELEFSLPDRHHRGGWPPSWAHNDYLRIVGILLPRCSTAAADEATDEATDGVPDSGPLNSTASAHETEAAGLPPFLAPLLSIFKSIQPTLAWLADTFEMPDYMAWLASPPEERNALHAVSLGIALLPMVLMRLSIPALAGDVYDPFLFILATLLSPFAAPWLLGMHWPLLAKVGLSAGFTVIAVCVCLRGVRTPVVHVASPARRALPARLQY
jgi:hypothetical protein